MHTPVPSVSFGPFVLDRSRRSLHRQGELVSLQPKAMDLLLVLVESAGVVVSKDELMQRVWPDTFVEEGNLPVTVYALRKALGEEGDTFIRTVPRRGYCFVAAVHPVNEPTPEAAPAAVTVPTADPPATAPEPLASRHRWAIWTAAALLLVAVAGFGYARSRPAAPPVGPIRSLAVLPFTLVDVDTPDEFLAVGLAADLSRQLADVEALAIRPIGSSVRFEGSADAVSAGLTLRVDAVVTGTVQRMGDRWRVTADLRRVADGAHLWSLPTEQQDLALDDVTPTLADGIAGMTQGDAGRARAATARGTANGDAYRSYLEGLATGSQLTVPGVSSAVEHFGRAVAADPSFTAAQIALATYTLLPASSAPTPAQLSRAKAAADRALALQPDVAAAHAARGMTLALLEHQWDAAGQELRQAVALRPNDAEARLWHALYLGALGRHDDAIREADLAVSLDPTGPRANFYRGFLLLMARRYDDAIGQFRLTPLELGVVTQQVAFGIAVANAKKTRHDRAQAVLDRIMTRAPSPQARAHLAFVQTEAGDRDAAAATLKAALADLTEPRPRTPRVMMAATQACLGQLDASFDNLARASEDGDSRIAFAAVDPALDCARRDARFADVLRSLGLTP